ncbi:MAG: response regulator transcription factor [Acetobacteraceae bacterium]|nr:response regulator transcription factor [Acetobacteraceae bacterium]
MPASPLRNGWFAFMFACLACLVAGQIGFFSPGVRQRVPARAWVSAILLATALLCGCVAVSVWILMPVAQGEFRSVLVIAYFWFAVLAAFVGANRVADAGVAVVLASLAGFALTARGGYSNSLAGVCVLVCLSLLIMRRLIWRAAERAAEMSQINEDKLRAFKSTMAKFSPEAVEADANVGSADRPPPPIQADPLPRATLAHEFLTKRQAQILRLVAQGMSNKEIARELNVSPSTIKTHLSQSIALLRASNRTEAAVKASSVGIT